MTRQQALLVALFLGLLHLVLANLYAAETPYRTPGFVLYQGHAAAPDIGAPDERQHVNYVARMAHGQPFPVLDPQARDAYENYEAHQPPLYYLLAGLWTRVVVAPGTSDISAPGEGVMLRRLNAFVGAAAVLGVFYLGLWGFKREDIALGGAAIVALLPMNVALSGAVSNDPLLIALCTWVLALTARAVADGWTWKLALGVGVLTGAALLTKTTAVALLPVLLLAVLIRQPRRPSPAMVVSALALIAAMAAPWLLRNQRLYGDPFALTAFQQAFPGSPHASDFVAALGPSHYWVQMVWWWTARSFFGVFGYMDIFWPSSLYVSLNLLFIVLALGWLFATRRGELASQAAVQWIIGVFVLLIVALFLQFNTTYFQAQARYLFPAIGPIAVVLAIGLAYLAKGHWKVGVAALGTLLLGLNVYTLTRLPDEFRIRTTATVAQGPTNRPGLLAKTCATVVPYRSNEYTAPAVQSLELQLQ